LDLQLVAYLAALRSLPEARALLNCMELEPAGGFYLKLRTKGTAKTREEAMQPAPRLYQHTGRFRGDLLERFDNRGEDKGDQFKFKLNKSEEFHKLSREPMEPEDFERLIGETDKLLRDFGLAIYEGDVSINPFRYKNEIACSRCDYAAVCRFDAWTQPYRVLRAEAQ